MKLVGTVQQTQLEKRCRPVGKDIETMEVSCRITPDENNPTAGVSGMIRFNVLPHERDFWPLGLPVTVTIEKETGGDS